MSRRSFTDDKPLVGDWWLASDPTNRVAGTLERSAAGHGVLRLEDVLIEPRNGQRGGFSSEAIPLIIGDTPRAARRVSLINCWESSRSNAEGLLPGPKAQSFNVESSLIPLGRLTSEEFAILKQPDPLVYGVWTRLDVLDQWSDRGEPVGEGKLMHYDDNSCTQTLTVHWPADLHSQTQIGSITITTAPIPVDLSTFQYRLVINQHSYVHCKLDPAVPVSKLHERVLTPLRTFFAFATDSQPSFIALSLHLAPDSGNPVDLWCVSAEVDADGNAHKLTPEEAEAVVRRGYFTARHIESRFDQVIGRWFEIFDGLELPISSIVAAADYRSRRFTSDYFQSAAFAAEALHRSLDHVVDSMPSDSMPSDQRKDITRRVLDALTPEERQIPWLQSRAASVASPRYEDRVAQLVQRSPMELQQAAGDDFAERVRKARNYFAHLNNSKQPRPENDELHRLTSLLVLVMIAHILHELGLEDLEPRVTYADRFWELQRAGLVNLAKRDADQADL